MSNILSELGRRARARRLEQGWTLREIAERSGVSPRFLVQLEAGRGNISVRRLADVARALETTAADLLTDSDARMPFVELDRRIEQAADLTLSELFSLHGEDYYRRLERDVLDAVLDERRPMVLATGGGIVTSAETYAALRKSTTTVWLRARPEDHWNRVVRQGDRRPMADHPQAMADLRTLLASREPQYASAVHTVDTSGREVDDVVEEIAAMLKITR
jgi:XRE family aerobic/anaerobic benzoate catabolism transcriptional regulator